MKAFWTIRPLSTLNLVARSSLVAPSGTLRVRHNEPSGATEEDLLANLAREGR